MNNKYIHTFGLIHVLVKDKINDSYGYNKILDIYGKNTGIDIIIGNETYMGHIKNGVLN
jgi:hypothetical protein